MRKIRSVKELPEWFNLTKYRGLEALDAEGWYWQISARYYMLHYSEDKFSGYTDDPSEELLETIRANPVLDVHDDRNSKYLYGLLFPPESVALASLDNVRDFINCLPAEHAEAAREYLNQTGARTHLPVALCKLRSSTEVSLQTLVAVDFTLPEQVLMEGFRALVQQVQSANARYIDQRERFRAPNFGEWIRVGLLPYIDLWAWALAEDVSIPNRVYADAIFVGDEEGEDTVRKTTHSLMVEIYQGNMLMILGALRNQR